VAAGLVVIAVFVTLLIWSRDGAREVMLNDGTLLRFYEATYGVKSAPKPRFRPVWLEKLSAKLPVEIQRLLPPPNPLLESSWTLGEETQPALTIWFSHYDRTNHQYLQSPGEAKFRSFNGDLTLFGSSTTDSLSWGAEPFVLHGWTLKNNSVLFNFHTNLISFTDRRLRFKILDGQDRVLGEISLNNPAFGRAETQ